ncbi:AraC family transcriptional regulator [Mangrovicoccus sp. HB161399]|uniref:AraC family transcriptional regulator n=1 Tax=Mangrovicoccus sp. HB161399 TaxID=2720392 RepID=UPI00155232BF|nr:AraC family transcriptional regulator [Mangrovicoccus sp. HB161399]
MDMQQPAGAARRAARLSRRVSQSFLEHEQALDGWEQIYRQLSAGQFSGRVEALEIGGMCLQRERVECCVENQFRVPEGSVVIGFNLPGSDMYNSDLGPVAAWEPLVIESARDHRVYARGCFDVLMVSFPQDRLPEELRATARLADDPQGQTARWLLSLLGSVQSGHASDSLLQMAPDLVADALSFWGGTAAVPDLPARRSMALFDEILAAAETALPEALSVTGLAAALGRPRAELRAACRTVTGVDLAQFLQARRLSEVHRVLAAGTAQGTKVSDVAMDHGFLHWGRFSQAYRKMFGERPSDTLQRPGPALRAAGPLLA